VSGDKDLHRLGQYGNARVFKVADMLDIVQGKGWWESGALVGQSGPGDF